jgi:hypothetical protein
MFVEFNPSVVIIGTIVILSVIAFFVSALIQSVRAHPVEADGLPFATQTRPGLVKFTIGVLLLLTIVQLPMAYSYTADGTTTIQFVAVLGVVANLGTALAYRKPRKGSIYVYAMLIALQVALMFVGFFGSGGVNPIELLFVVLQGMVLIGMALLWRSTRVIVADKG